MIESDTEKIINIIKEKYSSLDDKYKQQLKYRLDNNEIKGFTMHISSPSIYTLDLNKIFNSYLKELGKISERYLTNNMLDNVVWDNSLDFQVNFYF